MKANWFSSLSLVMLVFVPMVGQAALLVEATLRDGAYGGGVKVNMFSSCSQPSAAGGGEASRGEIA